jgi:NAD(P)-dependent dehydrogenase (short-subunit alcohol dehydrogenase family)
MLPGTFFMSMEGVLPTEMRKTALLLGYAGRIFEYVENLLSVNGIDTKHIGGDELRDFDHCRKTSESLFLENDIKYIVYSVLVKSGELSSRIADMDSEQWLRFKQLAFTNIFNVNRTYIKGMTESGGGRYLTVGSIVGVLPAWGEEVNGAVSASAFMMMKSNVLEISQKGINANAVALGLQADDNEMLRRHIPGGETISEYAAAEGIVRLLADMPDDMRGAVVPLDAGFSCGFMRDW